MWACISRLYLTTPETELELAIIMHLATPERQLELAIIVHMSTLCGRNLMPRFVRLP